MKLNYRLFKEYKIISAFFGGMLICIVVLVYSLINGLFFYRFERTGIA